METFSILLSAFFAVLYIFVKAINQKFPSVSKEQPVQYTDYSFTANDFIELNI